MSDQTKKPDGTHTILKVIGFLIILILILIFTTIFFDLKINQTPTKNTEDETSATNTKNIFLSSEEAVIIETKNTLSSSTNDTKVEKIILPIDKVLFEYIEVIDGCGPYFEGDCLNVRSGPGTDYPVVASLRNGMVLKVGGEVNRDEKIWYKIIFDEWLRYPERLKSDWYVSADYVKILLDEGEKNLAKDKTATNTKRILVDRSEQKLYAYENDELFMELSISTGIELTPTPRGEFTVFRKTPSRYMQGPLPYLESQKYYDLPGVPWNLYFTEGGAIIHGTYWHTSFGKAYSHGCVNLPTDKAKELYYWTPLGTKVTVRD